MNVHTLTHTQVVYKDNHVDKGVIFGQYLVFSVFFLSVPPSLTFLNPLPTSFTHPHLTHSTASKQSKKSLYKLQLYINICA